MQFEVRNLDIEWNASQQLISIKKSHFFLPVDEVNGIYTVDTVTFPKVEQFVGLRILSEKILHTPYIFLGEKKEELLKLKDPITNEIWWIQKGVWKKQYNKFVSESFRTAGTLDLIIQEQQLRIYNNTNNFTVRELEHFLTDFKNNLWEIILDANSVISANIEKNVPNVFSDQVIQCIDKFIEASEKIYKEPKFFLKEVQGLVPRAKVRPVARTFRELTTKQSPKLLSSRLHQTSFDTPENRYVHYCIDRLFFLITKMMERADDLSEQFGELAEQYQKDSEKVKRVEFKKIDKDLFDKEIDEVRQKIELTNKKLAEAVSISKNNFGGDDDLDDYAEIYETYSYDKHDNRYSRNQRSQQNHYSEYRLTIDNLYEEGRFFSFFCNKINGEDVRKKLINYPGKWVVFVYPKDVFNILKNFEKSSLEVHVSGLCSTDIQTTAKGKKYYEYKWTRIDSINFSAEPLKRLEAKRRSYENNNWSVPFSFDEKKELLQEAANLDSRVKHYHEAAKSFLKLNKQTKQQYQRLRELKLAFESLGIRKSNNYPNTMVFVQNPAYSAVRSNFNLIQKLSNITISQLESLITMEKLGLINVSVLYERWVLLQLIKVLTEYFHLSMEEDWKDKLIDAVLKSQYDLEFKTQMESNSLNIILSYEKRLSNGRRPDFILDVVQKAPSHISFDKTKQIAQHSEYFYEKPNITSFHLLNSKDSNKPSTVMSRLIMDAKFYDDRKEQSLNKTLQELYIDKNYSEDELNKVFIIHPSPFAITSKTSPFKWNINCDYGHVSPKNHKKGHIFLIPSFKYGHTIDNLKRLIVMHFQDALSVNYCDDSNKADNDYMQNYFCPYCGTSEKRKLLITHRRTIGGGDSWIIKCEACEGIMKETFCFNCSTRLFKNGFRWTYHRTYATQITNCRCPKCDADLYDLTNN